MNMQAAAMAMLLKDRKEQAKAGRREYIALATRTCATVYDAAYGEMFATTPRVKREALGEHACGPMVKLTKKKNRAERIAARA
jgi:hypothetical protein